MKKDIDLGSFTLENRSYTYDEKNNTYGGNAFYFYDGIKIENGTIKNASQYAGNPRVAQGVAGPNAGSDGTAGIEFYNVTFSSINGAMVSASGLKTIFDGCTFETNGNNGLYINTSNKGAVITDCTSAEATMRVRSRLTELL